MTQEPDYDLPWQVQSPTEGSGSGVIIGKNMVLTGAHVVANATFIEVQRSDPERRVARVEAICHDCDLALLIVEDSSFTDNVAFAELGSLPNLRDEIQVVGFPIGGEELSITEGVVSRIEAQTYSHSKKKMLAITVDAAINPGNSGGPVFKDGKIVGIAFQKLEEGENNGELVPVNIVRWFLNAIEEGQPLKMPTLGVSTQNLRNSALRDKYKLPKGKTGVLVASLQFGAQKAQCIQQGDILLRIADHDIANNSTVLYKGRYRTIYWVALTEYYVGDSVEIGIWRDGKELSVEVELLEWRNLVKRNCYDTRPTFFVYGG